MTGTLYLCATPIGNLEDITLRVLRILKEVDLIAAEDTRNSIKLLNHFEIKTKMTSYHEYNKIDKAVWLVERLKEGMNIALITDAGTPGISDPGEELVRKCHEEGITVTSLPGACAGITALTMSGQSTRRFVFEAFLPYEKKERNEVLDRLKDETRTMVLYEAPHRLKRTLKELRGVLGSREITVCKELTKRYENRLQGDLDSILEYYEENEPRGEYVLVIAGRPQEEIRAEEQKNWESVSIEDHMAGYEKQGIDRKTAMKMVAKDRGISKRDVYRELNVDK